MRIISVPEACVTESIVWSRFGVFPGATDVDGASNPAAFSSPKKDRERGEGRFVPVVCPQKPKAVKPRVISMGLVVSTTRWKTASEFYFLPKETQKKKLAQSSRGLWQTWSRVRNKFFCNTISATCWAIRSSAWRRASIGVHGIMGSQGGT